MHPRCSTSGIAPPPIKAAFLANLPNLSTMDRSTSPESFDNIKNNSPLLTYAECLGHQAPKATDRYLKTDLRWPEDS